MLLSSYFLASIVKSLASLTVVRSFTIHLIIPLACYRLSTNIFYTTVNTVTMRSTAVSALLALVAVQQAAANVRTPDQDYQRP